MSITSEYLRRDEAARYVRERWGVPCATRTLAKLACISSDGPVFRRAGRFPIYAIPDLDAWARKKISPPMRSNSDAGM